jgi:hypothetical protein
MMNMKWNIYIYKSLFCWFIVYQEVRGKAHNIYIYTWHVGAKLGFVVLGDGTKILIKRMRHKRLTFRFHRRNSGPVGAWPCGNLIQPQRWEMCSQVNRSTRGSWWIIVHCSLSHTISRSFGYLRWRLGEILRWV